MHAAHATADTPLIQSEDHSRIPAPQRRPLLGLFIANAISITGNVFALIAIPWFVLETTGSAALTGVAAAMNTLPYIFGGVLGGAFVDRVGFRRASIISDLASAVGVAIIPLLHALDLLNFPLLLICIVLGGLMDPPGNTARAAMLPDLADRAGIRRERVNALEQTVMRLAMMLGAPLGGALLAVVGTATGLWLNAVSFLVSAALVALLVPRHVAEQEQAEASAQPQDAANLRESLRIGITFLRENPLMQALIIQIAITNMFDAMVSVQYPVFARETFGSASALGIMMGASGLGAVTTALLYGAFGHRLPRREVYFGAFTLTSIPLMLLSLQPILLLAAACTLVRGFGAGPLNPILMTVEQERIPAAMRGRVIGVGASLAWIAMPIGHLLGGLGAATLGVTTMLFMTGLLYCGTCLFAASRPVFRQMNAPVPALATATAPVSVSAPTAPLRTPFTSPQAGTEQG